MQTFATIKPYNYLQVKPTWFQTVRRPEIEGNAYQILDSYQSKHGSLAFPIPIEKIVENELGLSYEFADLEPSYGKDTLGLIDLTEGHIKIAEALSSPQNEVLFLSTLAHEATHFVEHRNKDLNRACRVDGKSGLFEREAEFGSAVWQLPRTVMQPYLEKILDWGTKNGLLKKGLDWFWGVYGALKLAIVAKVSVAKALIRLAELGLIKDATVYKGKQLAVATVV